MPKKISPHSILDFFILFVIVPPIKGFVVLIPPSLGYQSPVMPNLMKLTSLSLAPKPNLFPLFIFQISWNCIFTVLIHPSYHFFTTHSSIQFIPMCYVFWPCGWVCAGWYFSCRFFFATFDFWSDLYYTYCRFLFFFGLSSYDHTSHRWYP